MNTRFILSAFLGLSLMASLAASPLALAQVALSTTAPTALDQLHPGYAPTVFESKAQIERLYESMPWSEFKPGDRRFNPSQCYMRAQLWTYDFYRNQSVNAMKVFVFYTHAYKKWYEGYAKANKLRDKKFDWWYHVAPYVLLKNNQTQELEEWVLDPTFDYLDPNTPEKPLKMKPWTDLFVASKRACKEFTTYQEFRCEVEGSSEDCPKIRLGAEHCYIVRVPATIYDPDQIELLHSGAQHGFNWVRKDLEEAADKAPSGLKNQNYWRKRIGLPSR